ncbi:hypothetical protein EYF80_050496 [Liparis tanakae]|uniref:Uncharacterized protein n=1 Tax=Liparis tanakae TaxID=230148 RepID=A0A4Z2FDM0_9TELE|nr:hypothetical protein EYF80_050496 [Liparis tanakae]
MSIKLRLNENKSGVSFYSHAVRYQPHDQPGATARVNVAAGKLFSRPRGSCKALGDKNTPLNMLNAPESRAASSSPVKQRRGYESVDAGGAARRPARDPRQRMSEIYL